MHPPPACVRWCPPNLHQLSSGTHLFGTQKVKWFFSDGGLGIPVVRLLIGGDVSTPQTILRGLQRNIPLLVCVGTDRVANLLERVHLRYDRIMFVL